MTGPVIFADETARAQLVEEGVVVTFRTSERTTGSTWWRKSRTGPKQGDVVVEKLGRVDATDDAALGPHRDLSGFDSVAAWREAIRGLNGEVGEGYLYRVRSDDEDGDTPALATDGGTVSGSRGGDAPTVDDVVRVLDAIDTDKPATLEVVDRLADATAVDTDTAQRVVWDAIDAGVVVEEGEGFGQLRHPAGRDRYAVADTDTDPLDQYAASEDTPRYVFADGDTDDRLVAARDAATRLTATTGLPPHETEVCDDTDPWGEESYWCATAAVERAVVDALLDGEDTDTPSDDTEPTDSLNTAELNPEEPDSSDETPTPEAGETGPESTDAGPLEDCRAVFTGEERHPPGLAAKPWWVTWILDGVGRKRPVAPWKTGHAYPAEWRGDLDDDDRPETTYETAERWASFDLDELGLSLPEDAQTDRLDLGVILPVDRPPREERVVLIDWDDVRDPETEEVHPVAAEYIRRCGGYVEISTSGEGLHQFVFGGLQHRDKFIAPVDDEPFIGEDLPQVEIYDGGRHVAMTGRHVEGSGEDLVDGQDLIDTIVSEYADAERDAGHRRYDPETGETSADTGEPEHTTDVPRPEAGEYAGAPVEHLRERKPTGRSLDYHAVVETFYRGGGNAGGFAHIQNWRLEGFAAALGERDDLSPQEVKADLAGGYLNDTDVECGCRHETPHRVDYAFERARTGRLEPPTAATLARYGVLPPEALGGSEENDPEDRRDPRELEATVDPRRAWNAAARVTPADVNDSADLEPADDDPEAFACPVCGDAVNVVRAVAVREGLVESCDDTIADEYPEAYTIAREEGGAPLPRYLTTSDAVASFDAVLDVIREVTFSTLDREAFVADVVDADDDSDAVAYIDPSPVDGWRDSDSGESVLVFDSGVVWDADTERVIDTLRLVALDRGLIGDPRDPLEGSAFTEAYALARDVYHAPLPRWEPAADGARELTAQLPPSEELVDTRDVDGVDVDALGEAREDVEALLREATDPQREDVDTPVVVTALPGLGKTTGTVKTAADRPLSYLPPRKELQLQALEKARRWGVEARVLPVLAEASVREEVLAAAVADVRERGKDRLRDRWAVLQAAADALRGDTDLDDLDAGDIFEDDDEDDDEVDLPRATCPTAEGAHGPAWALAVHVARRLGYSPREIHADAQGLFGASLPCEEGGDCSYSLGWERARDPDDPADLLVGSRLHAHVESVRTYYERRGDGRVDRSVRPVVVDEFVGEAYTSTFGPEAEDYATWLARALREDVDDRRDMFDRDLGSDPWVRAWLDGEGDSVDGVADAAGALGRLEEYHDARAAAERIDEEVDTALLDDLDLREALEVVLANDDPAGAATALRRAVEVVEPDHPAAGVAGWVEEDVLAPLLRATVAGSVDPRDAVTERVDASSAPIGGDLERLVDDAVAAVRAGDEVAPQLVEVATTALRGGEEGCRRLAAWANDGYAHPDAHHLLAAIVTPTDGDTDDEDDARLATRVRTSEWAFDPDATDGTVLDVVETTDTAAALVDRNGHGALLHTPPDMTAGDGNPVPLVGLDATGRRETWATALRAPDVRLVDIHDTPAERRAFLEDVLDVRVLQAADRPRWYEGDPSSKDLDGDVALLEALADEYGGIEAPRQRGDEASVVGRPAAITTKSVREVLENDPRLDDVVAAWDHYGNVTGKNDLGRHRLAAVLGTQHYGDTAIERFAALVGEEVDTDRGDRSAALEYGGDVANAYLAHMSEDQTMQAILRFARGGDGGATVVARTGALREDLPVVGRAQVVETWNDTATAIARHYRTLGREFTAADVRDVVDVSARQVRRVFAELVEAGYLQREDHGPGRAHTYERVGDPSAGEVDLPDRSDVVVGGGTDPGRSASKQYYTWNVRVRGGDSGLPTAGTAPTPRVRGAPPSPDGTSPVEPPG